MSGDITCPYCGAGNNLSEGNDYVEGECCPTECEWCDKPFFYTVEYNRILVVTKEDES